MSATRAFEKITQHAIENQLQTELLVIPVDLPCDSVTVAQGDINILRISEVPSIAKPCEKVRQLADGNSKGSRHCIKAEHLAHCDFWELPNPNPLEGPIVRFNKDTVIEHPEHKDQLWPAGFIVAIAYQRAGGPMDQLRRAMD